MSDFSWSSDAQMGRTEPYIPKSHGKPRVDDRPVLIGIIFINRNDLRWRDTPREYGPHKTLYILWMLWKGVPKRQRFERGHEPGVFARIMAGLAAEHGDETTVMIDAARLKAHRAASSLGVKREAWASD